VGVVGGSSSKRARVSGRASGGFLDSPEPSAGDGAGMGVTVGGAGTASGLRGRARTGLLLGVSLSKQ